MSIVGNCFFFFQTKTNKSHFSEKNRHIELYLKIADTLLSTASVNSIKNNWHKQIDIVYYSVKKSYQQGSLKPATSKPMQKSKKSCLSACAAYLAFH
jgi:hypothetical protein